VRPRLPVIKGIIAIASACVVSEACRSQSHGTTPEPCAPVSAALPATTSAEGLAGEYRLNLVASSGPRKGSAAEGTLHLEPQDSSRRYRMGLAGRVDSTIVHPLLGSTDLDLNAVDAISVGRTDSRNPERPGVLVIERHARPGRTPQSEITMRLGSDANRSGQTRFDGGYTALRVRKVGPQGFAGSWSSGVTGERAAGFFCAVREDGKDGKVGKEAGR
jgi:hypothetical protein